MVSVHLTVPLAGRSTRRLAAAIVLLLLAGWAARAPAGTRRQDVADDVHISLAAQPDYASAGSISVSGMTVSGVLVANNYVLTAAHVGQLEGTMAFTLPSGTYLHAWKVLHPDWTGDVVEGSDLALIRLATLVLEEQPAVLYAGASEIGQTGVVVGFGRTGTGVNGATESGGTERAGKNVWEIRGPAIGYSADVLVADFDSPLSQDDNWFGGRLPIDLEYMAAWGDSGGGMFLSDGGTQKLAGITSFVASRDGAADSDYGDAMVVGRILSHMSFLNEYLSEPATMSWVGASGGYNEAGNWTTTFNAQAVNAVPGNLDAVEFGSGSAHTVTWPAADLANARMSVDSGDVTLNLSGQTHTLRKTGLWPPSLVVGAPGQAEPADQALTVLNGTLSTQNAFLVADAGSEVRMTVGAGATWTVTGFVFVGGTSAGLGSTAELIVADDAQVDITGELTLWSGGTLTLAGGSVSAEEVTVPYGSTLAGTGTIIGDLVVSGGIISPGSTGEASAPAGVYFAAQRVSALPEPATMTALGAGAVLLLTRRCRRNRR